MTAVPLRRWLLLAGVAFLVTLVLLAVANAPAPISASGQSVDTAALSRLQADPAGSASGLQGAVTITDTYAAVLAVGPLLQPIFSALFVPVIIR